MTPWERDEIDSAVADATARHRRSETRRRVASLGLGVLLAVALRVGAVLAVVYGLARVARYAWTGT